MRPLLERTLAVCLFVAACADTKPSEEASDGLTTRADIAYAVSVGGRLVPREEVFVRPLVSGLIADVRVQAGQRVKKGHHLATVRIVADPVMLAEARASARRAAATLASAARELSRVRGVEGGRGIAARDIAQAEDAERLARSELAAAEERARLIAQGVASTQRAGDGGARSTHILAPVDGTVLALPVAVGDFVSESSTFRDGTAVAILADMDALVFKGFVEEAHVGSLKLGMPAEVRVGALGGSALPGTLRWIAPRASVEAQPGTLPTSATGQPVLTPLTASTSGSTRFELWIDVANDGAQTMRAGYTAAAELLLAKHSQVLSVPESALKFESGKALAQVRVGNTTELRTVTLGLSDGVRVEVLTGLREGDQLVAPKQ